MADAMTLSCFASSISLMFNESLGYVEVGLLILNSFSTQTTCFRANIFKF